MTDDFSLRRTRLAQIARANGFGAFAFVPGANFAYLTGLHFHLMERPTILFVAGDSTIAGIIPELEREKWEVTFPEAQTFYWQDADGYERAFADAAIAFRGEIIGIEGMRMRVFEGDALRRHFRQDSVVDAGIHLAGVRLSKSSGEIAALTHAIRISEQALAETIFETRTGQTEREILNRLRMHMLAGGAEGFAFDPIVLIAGNAANPHGSPGDRPLAPGDALLIDFGASYGGMNADITRTFFCEFASDRHAQIYDTVLAANARGRDLSGPERTAHEIDVAVTAVLAASPFADMIAHKTGHGLGMDVHESPQIMRGNHQPLVEGAVFTIEPGLYQSGEIGVRIEDNVVITGHGAQSLTSFPRDLTIVGRQT